MVDTLKQHMEANGLFILGEINSVSTKFQRFKDANYPYKGKSIYVLIFGSGKGAIYGDWRQSPEPYVWFAQDWKTLSQQEKRRRKFEIEAAKNQLKFEQEENINNCKIIFNLSEKPHLNHLYIQKKQIIPYSAKQYAEMLILPVYSLSGQIQAIQYIYEDGFKKFHDGAPVAGGFLILGNNFSNPIRLCEGWSTGCTIREILNEPVIVTFSRHNMKKIALLIKRKIPTFKQIIYADNDHQTIENYGLITAREIQVQTSAKIIYPIFPQHVQGNNLSDFNDLACVFGVSEAKRQLMSYLV